MAGGAFTYFTDPIAGPARRRRLVARAERRSDDVRDLAASIGLVKDAVLPDETASDTSSATSDETPTDPPAIAGVTDLGVAATA